MSGPVTQVRVECEEVLRSLPGWFGIESALLEYAEATQRLPTFIAMSDGRVTGFITLEALPAGPWEVHCIAVRDQCRGKGIGSALIACAERWSSERGARVLVVKTLAESHPSPEYAQSRAFYLSRGFVPERIIPGIWGPSNPCLQMRKEI